MKFATTLINSFVTCSVIVAFGGQQIAFAAPAQASASAQPLVAPMNVTQPLKQALNGKQGIEVIAIADARPLASYFVHGGTADEIKRLNTDIKNLAIANSEAGMADDLPQYQAWWLEHQTSILLSKKMNRTASLQIFFYQTFIMFKAEETEAQKDPNRFFAWLSMRVTNPYIRFVSYGTFTITVATFAWLIGIVKGAMVAGPAAGSIGALVEPMVRPIREKFGIIGARWFGKWGSWLTSRLNKEKKTEVDLDHQGRDLSNARGAAYEARVVLNQMGYDMAPAAYAANINRLHDIWNQTNYVWSNTNTPIFRDGRSVVADALYLRPQSFSGQVMQSLQGAEQARQGIEANIDRIIERTHQEPKLVEDHVVELLRAVELQERADQLHSDTAKEQVAKAKDALKALGATDYSVDRIVEMRINELIYAKHTATTLAANVIHEIQYPELNRALPDIVSDIQRVLREGYCLDYFHHQFKDQVTKILDGMDFQIELAQNAVKAGQADPASPLKVVKPQAKPETEGGIRNFIRSRAERATSALSRLNGMGANRAAIERSGGQLEKPREEKTTAEVARDVVKAVGKK